MRLRKKLLLSILLVALVPYTIGLAVVRAVTKKSITGDVLTALTSYGENISDAFGDFFSQKISYTRAMAGFSAVKDLNWPEVKAAITELNEHAYEDFILVREDGSYYKNTVFGNPYYGGLISQNDKEQNAELKYLTDRDYYKYLVAENTSGEFRSIVTNPVVSLSTGATQIICGSSVIKNGKAVGLVGATLTLREIEKMYTSTIGRFKETFGLHAVAVVQNTKGENIINYQYDENGRGYVNKNWEMSPEMTEAFALMSSNYTEPVQFKANGRNYYAAMCSVPNSGYKVFIAAPEQDLFKAVYYIQSAMLVLIGITAFLVILISLILAFRMVKPLNSTAKTLKDIASGNGDLTYRVEILGHDEISSVGNYVNDFISSQHTMISKIREQGEKLQQVSQNLANHTENISNQVSAIANGVSDLNFQTEEQSASVTETSATIKEISQNIENLAKMIETQTEALSESSAAIQQMVASFESISTNLYKAGKSFDNLQKSSREGKQSIGNVQELVSQVSAESEHLVETNEIINSIASQTNLLAMNAAIEAAHAGESGKGFSVVADEIRKLAEDSSSQSKGIEQALKSIVEKINTIVEASTTARTAFDSVAENINETTKLTGEIAVSMREQNEGSKKVIESLKSMESITVQIRDGSVEMNSGASMILKEMNRLASVSEKVSQTSRDIARATEQITEVVDSISETSSSNTEAADVLNELTGKFKL